MILQSAGRGFRLLPPPTLNIEALIFTHKIHFFPKQNNLNNSRIPRTPLNPPKPAGS